MLAIKSKFPGDIASKINGKAWYAPRGDRVVQNIKWTDPALGGELIVRTQTLPDVNINHKRQNSLVRCLRDAVTTCAANWAHGSTCRCASLEKLLWSLQNCLSF